MQIGNHNITYNGISNCDIYITFPFVIFNIRMFSQNVFLEKFDTLVMKIKSIMYTFKT